MRKSFFLLLLACLLLANTLNVTNARYLRDDEERAFDAKKIDDLISPLKVKTSMLLSPTRDKMFSKWAKNSAVSDKVLNALSQDPVKNKKVIEAFKGYNGKLDQQAAAQIAKLANVKTVKEETALFKAWFKNEGLTNAIVKNLSKDFKKNEATITAFNDYRTLKTYGNTIDGWLKTSDLKALAKASKDKDEMTIRTIYGKWFEARKTVDDLKTALRGEWFSNARYKAIFKGYDDFYEKTAAKVAKLAEDKPKINRRIPNNNLNNNAY